MNQDSRPERANVQLLVPGSVPFMSVSLEKNTEKGKYIKTAAATSRTTITTKTVSKW